MFYSEGFQPSRFCYFWLFRISLNTHPIPFLYIKNALFCFSSVGLLCCCYHFCSLLFSANVRSLFLASVSMAVYHIFWHKVFNRHTRLSLQLRLAIIPPEAKKMSERFTPAKERRDQLWWWRHLVVSFQFSFIYSESFTSFTVFISPLLLFIHSTNFSNSLSSPFFLFISFAFTPSFFSLTFPPLSLSLFFSLFLPFRLSSRFSLFLNLYPLSLSISSYLSASPLSLFIYVYILRLSKIGRHIYIV